MKKNKIPTIALMYDFDKTLCTTDMQNYELIPNLGVKKDAFWSDLACVEGGGETRQA